MHILYVHQNFPAQFGHIARHLVQKMGWRCTFVSQTEPGVVEGIEKIQYQIKGGATQHTHFCSRTFENGVWHTDAVFQALKARPDIRPDLIVGHSGFGSTLFLPEILPDTPIINFFEYYYRPHAPDSDMDFRRDLDWKLEDAKYNRARCRNAMILLDLHNCDTGYTPTDFQRSRFPDEYLPKLRTIFDGVDRSVFHGHGDALRPSVKSREPRTLSGVHVGPETRIITYCSRGFESMRGFDTFMKVAKRIYEEYPDVLFLCVGGDKIAYGGDESYLGGHKSFREWTLAQDRYDLSKFAFLGKIPAEELAKLLSSTDLHIYLTAPFVLSWSMMDAMSCGAVVLGSKTAPVEEMITHGKNGLLCDYFDTESMARKAVRVLRDPDSYRPIGRAAEELVESQYSLDAVMPRMIQMYEECINKRPLPTLDQPLPERPSTLPAAPAPAPIAPQAAAPRPRKKSPFFG
jgi:glycosyltransferase involved in cell wall biosynthesis